MLGVSRSSVREALAILVAAGKLAHGRAAEVSGLRYLQLPLNLRMRTHGTMKKMVKRLMVRRSIYHRRFSNSDIK